VGWSGPRAWSEVWVWRQAEQPSLLHFAPISQDTYILLGRLKGRLVKTVFTDSVVFVR
jgi:hypothetical protein